MEPADDVTLVVWPLAALEATLTGWGQIEPHHMLCAALKFVELSAEELNQAFSGQTLPEAASEGRRRLEQLLQQQYGLPIPEGTQRLRRALRLSGPGRPTQSVLHRSEATRALFDRASRLAADEGRNRFDAADLARAILEDPAGPAAAVLRRLEIAPAEPCENPIEQEHPDFFRPVQPAANHTVLRAKENCGPVLKLLEQWLAQPVGERRPCLLLATGGATAAELLSVLASWSHAKCRFVEVDSQALLRALHDASAPGVLQQLAQHTPEGLRARDVYFFDNFHRHLLPEVAGARLAQQMPHWVAGLDGRFLFSLTEAHYRRLIAPRPEWKRLLREIWIHEKPDTMML